jgi:16S rRNA (guanine527-N7)-methyltransferase
MKEKLQKYNGMLIEKNAFINLTAHKTLDKSWHKNILDSLLFVDEFQNLGKVKILDIGCGAGLPGIPLAIECPSLDVTMIDSVNKKTEFIKDVICKLDIKNAAAVHTRIEDFTGAFDIVTAKAVAPLPTLLEYAIPLLKLGGKLFAFKGQNYESEIKLSKKAMQILGAKIERIEQKVLDGDIVRCLIIIKKTAKTAGIYPRKKNLPRLCPLM